jgi:hypothetical protein
MRRNAIIDTDDYDLVITCKDGIIHTYQLGKEILGVKSLEFKASVNELAELTITKGITDKNGNMYIIGRKIKESEINENFE